MKTIVQRIREIARDLNIGEGRFEISLGLSVGYLNITHKRTGDPGVSILKNLVETYPEYSLNWIITGEGSMKVANPLILNADTSGYNKEASAFQKSMIKLVEQVVAGNGDPKFEALNDSVLRLMKRDLKKKEINIHKKFG